MIHNVFHTTTENLKSIHGQRVIFPNVSTGFSFHKHMNSAEAEPD